LSTFADIQAQSPFVDKVVPVRVNSMRDFAVAVRGRRRDLGLSQADLAARVGVSRAWIIAVESAKSSVEFGLVLRLLDHLGLALDVAERGSFDNVSTGGSFDLDSHLDEYRGL
jgi:HTH-type transcriptional regulator/antitoxin HipB